jgi:hypothetical protein
MEFTLLYEGELLSAGDSEEKHRLREYFHPQLFQLWHQRPLDSHRWRWHKDQDHNIHEEIDGRHFVPNITTRLKLVGELDILLLRPEEPGRLISGGDVDNKLKTLFDGLRTPNIRTEVPQWMAPNSDREPLLCLFEDDKLITRVNVKVDRLLKDVSPKSVNLVIRVKIKASEVTSYNLPFLG